MVDNSPDAREFAIYYRVAAARERQVDVAKAFEISQSQVSKIVAKLRAWVGVVKPDRARCGLHPSEEVFAAADLYRAKLECAEKRATEAFDLTMKQAEAGHGRVKPCARLHKAMVESIKEVFEAEKVCAVLRAEAAEAAAAAKVKQAAAPAHGEARNTEYSSAGAEEGRCFRGAKGDTGEAKGDAGEAQNMEYSAVIVAPVVDEDSLAALACSLSHSYWEVVYANNVVNELVAETIEEYGNIPEEEMPVSAAEMQEYDGNITPLSTARWWTTFSPEYRSTNVDQGRYFRGAKGDTGGAKGDTGGAKGDASFQDRSPEVTERYDLGAKRDFRQEYSSAGAEGRRYFRGAKGDTGEGILQLACAAAR